MTPAEALANAKVNGVDPVIIGDGEKNQETINTVWSNINA